MSKHLHRRGDSFQYRRVFPADVRATAGRRELTKSLKVKTLKEAELEAALWDVEFEEIVATARGTGQPSDCTQVPLAQGGTLQIPAACTGVCERPLKP